MADPKPDSSKTDGPKMKVVLRSGVHIRRDDTDYGPGSVVEVDKAAADSLLERGLADREGAEGPSKDEQDQEKAERDAEADATVIEESKERSLDQLNVDRIQPASVQPRRGPGRPRKNPS